MKNTKDILIKHYNDVMEVCEFLNYKNLWLTDSLILEYSRKDLKEIKRIMEKYNSSPSNADLIVKDNLEKELDRIKEKFYKTEAVNIFMLFETLNELKNNTFTEEELLNAVNISRQKKWDIIKTPNNVSVSDLYYLIQCFRLGFTGDIIDAEIFKGYCYDQKKIRDFLQIVNLYQQTK
jgi:hypothetical protein